MEMTQTWVIRQDCKGVMYFGTSRGITTFDGENWQTIKLPNNSAVLSMAISKSGVVFAGGMDEFGYLKVNSNGFLEYISLTSKLPATIHDFGLVKDLWVLNDDVGFFCDRSIFILHNDSFQILNSSSFFEKGYVVNDNLYICERGIGLKKLVGSKLELISGGEAFSKFPPFAMLSGSNDEMVAFSMANGAYKHESSHFAPFGLQDDEFLKKGKVTCGIGLKNNNIVLGTVLNGLVLINQEGKTLLKLSSEQGLDNNNVMTLFEDCNDNLWVGHDNGVTYVEINSPFTIIPNKIVPGIGYASILHNNYLYLGTSQGLFACSLLDNGSKWAYPKFQLIEGSEGIVRSLTYLDGELLLGHENGTYVINGLDAKQINSIHGGWTYQKLMSNPSYMIEGCYSGFLLYKKVGNSWQFMNKIGGFDESCRVFEQDDDGRIWVAHGYKGLYSLELSENFGEARNIRFYGKKNGFPSNLGINVFKVDKDLVFTSEKGGIYNYIEKSDSFVLNPIYDQYLGPLPKISKLSEQEKGNIWVNEEGRIGVLVKQNNRTYRYDYKEFNKLENSMVKGFEHFETLPDNSVLFGYGYGFLHYDPSKRKDFNSPFYTLIHKVEAINSTDSILLSLDSTDFLDYANNSLRFSFSAAFYENMEATRYSYLLEGFDEKWSEWSSETIREYTNLPEGNYAFHVKAKNIYGVEGYEGLCQFVIKPPLSRTWWAYLLYFLLGFGVLALSFRFYSKQRLMNLIRDNDLKDQEIIKLKYSQLASDLEFKNKELGSLATQLVNKNAILQQIKDYLNSVYNRLGAKEQKEIIALTRLISSEADTDKEWNLIEPHFDNVHNGFLQKLKEKYPELRPHDLKLCAYIRMNLSSKEIAVLMNNTPHGVEAHRYRLRKVFGFNRDVNLKDFLSSL